jgi:hypothetical protein
MHKCEPGFYLSIDSCIPGIKTPPLELELILLSRQRMLYVNRQARPACLSLPVNCFRDCCCSIPDDGNRQQEHHRNRHRSTLPVTLAVVHDVLHHHLFVLFRT